VNKKGGIICQDLTEQDPEDKDLSLVVVEDIV